MGVLRQSRERCDATTLSRLFSVHWTALSQFKTKAGKLGTNLEIAGVLDTLKVVCTAAHKLFASCTLATAITHLSATISAATEALRKSGLAPD